MPARTDATSSAPPAVVVARLLDELTEVAATLTGRPESTRASIAATLDAASLDAALQDDLGRGRLTVELATPVRFFGEFADDTPGPPRAPRDHETGGAGRTTCDELAARRAATALADARAHAEEAEGELRDADAGVRDTQDQLDGAHLTRRRPRGSARRRAAARSSMPSDRSRRPLVCRRGRASGSDAPKPRSTSPNVAVEEADA